VYAGEGGLLSSTVQPFSPTKGFKPGVDQVPPKVYMGCEKSSKTRYGAEVVVTKTAVKLLLLLLQLIFTEGVEVTPT